MNIDRNSLERLLSLNDRQFKAVIEKLAKSNGIDPSVLNIDEKNIKSIRNALGGATDSDLEKIAQMYREHKNSKR